MEKVVGDILNLTMPVQNPVNNEVVAERGRAPSGEKLLGCLFSLLLIYGAGKVVI
jgi:hypothetical protein